MTDTEVSGGTRVGAVVGMLGLVAALTVGAIALGSDTPAGASGLTRFESCAELQAWTDELQAPMLGAEEPATALEGAGSGTAGSGGVSAGAPTSAAPAPMASDAARDDSTSAAAPQGAAAEGAAPAGDADTGGTNTVVEGVDEIDVIDRVAEDRLLVTRNGHLALVDLADRALVADFGAIAFDARISVDGDPVWVAGSSEDGLGTRVQRVRIDGDSLTADGEWRAPGYLLDARRDGDRFVLVTVEYPQPGAVPFDGGPVPCDQVWRPVDPATTPAATLVATLPPTGELAPTAVAEIAGSAGTILVTNRSVYVATQTYATDGEIATGVHRFEPSTLTPTGSGAVPGAVAGPFALSEEGDLLRVATSRSGGGFLGRPMPVEGDAIAGDVGVGVGVASPLPAVGDDVTSSVAAEEPPLPPETTIPGDTTIPEATTIPTDTTVVIDTTIPEERTIVPEETTVPDELTFPVETTVPPEGDADALAEIFVLDTDGDLDVAGATGRFGHAGETIQGVRFVGAFAYVVTFLQTDPFWVVDLSDPAAPAVVGQLQIPGFSGYLHPVADGLVVGFGPDGEAGMAARLFDVHDPANPTLLDQIPLGDDSPVAYDHHAFVDLDGDRFAVPFTEYPTYEPGPGRCLDDVQVAPVLPDTPTTAVDPNGGGTTEPGSTIVEPAPPVCEYTPVGGSTGAAVLEVSDGRLQLAERATIDTTDVYAERVVLASDGTWFILSWDRLAGTDGSSITLPTA